MAGCSQPYYCVGTTTVSTVIMHGNGNGSVLVRSVAVVSRTTVLVLLSNHAW